MTNILEEAIEQVYKNKEKLYGHPSVNLQREAAFWSVILGIVVTPKQVALCKLTSNVARELNAHKRDNLVDMAGYAAVIERLGE